MKCYLPSGCDMATENWDLTMSHELSLHKTKPVISQSWNQKGSYSILFNCWMVSHCLHLYTHQWAPLNSTRQFQSHDNSDGPWETHWLQNKTTKFECGERDLGWVEMVGDRWVLEMRVNKLHCISVSYCQRTNIMNKNKSITRGTKRHISNRIPMCFSLHFLVKAWQTQREWYNTFRILTDKSDNQRIVILPSDASKRWKSFSSK